MPSFAISFSRSNKFFPSCNAPINASSMFFRRSWIFDKKFFTASISIGSNVSLQAISNALMVSRHSSARLYNNYDDQIFSSFYSTLVFKEESVFYLVRIKDLESIKVKVKIEFLQNFFLVNNSIDQF